MLTTILVQGIYLFWLCFVLPVFTSHLLVQKRRHFLKSWVENEFWCLCTVDIANVNFTKLLHPPTRCPTHFSNDMIWYEVKWCDIHVIWYDIISYDIMWYHIISYYMTWHNVMSNHIISYHITSHHITSHHIKSHHITSYHIISNLHPYSRTGWFTDDTVPVK